MDFSDVFDLKQSLNRLKRENKRLKEDNQQLRNKLEVINREQATILQCNNLLNLIISSALSLTSCSGVALLVLDDDYIELNFVKQGEIDSELKNRLLASDRLSKLFNKKGTVSLTDGKLNDLQKPESMRRSLSLFPFEFRDDKKAVLLVGSNEPELMISDYRTLLVLNKQIYYLVDNSLELKTKDSGLYLKTVTSLTNAIDAKDVYTAGHSQRVSKLAVNIARNLNLSKSEIQQVEYGAILHDIGKIGIPEHILNKQGPLNNLEYDKIKKHPTIGVDILKGIDFLDEVFNVINYHHERVDGTGYPHGLAKSEIPLEARIVCVADAWDAMTSTRSYRRPLSLNRAIKELKENAGGQFDQEIISELQENSFKALLG